MSTSHFIHSIFSYNPNVLLASIISLLLVILFVFLLHVYAKWFWSHFLSPTRFPFHSFTFENYSLSNSPTKGLDASTISSIPLFVYNAEEHKQRVLECVVCLSVFEEGDIGRTLSNCHHVFHVQCIDMWLHSHSSCPICRAPVVCQSKMEVGNSVESSTDLISMEEGELGLVGGECRVEIVVDVSDSRSENGTRNNRCLSGNEEKLLLGCSLKRMLSRNRSEWKVHPSS